MRSGVGSVLVFCACCSGFGGGPLWAGEGSPAGGRTAVRERVAGELAELADSAWPDVRKASLEALALLGEVPLRVAAERLLSDPDTGVRVRAAAVLAASNRTEAGKILERVFLSDAAPEVRYAALDGLFRLDKDRAGERFRGTVLDDVFSRRRRVVKQALIFLCGHPDLPLAMRKELLDAGAGEFRLLAATALLNRGDFAGFRSLVAALESEEEAFRRTLAWVLRFLKNGRRWGEQALKVLLSDASLDVRLTAVESAAQGSFSSLAGVVGRKLLQGVEDTGERRSMAAALREFGTEEAVSYLLEGALRGWPLVCLELARSVDADGGGAAVALASGRLSTFRRLARGASGLYEVALWRVLASCGEPGMLERLEGAAFSAADARVRRTALEGLARHGDGFTLERICRFMSARRLLPGRETALDRVAAARAAVAILKRFEPVEVSAPLP